MDPLTVLATFLPVLVKGGQAAVSRWLAPKEFRPSTIEEWTAMQANQLEWFKALQAAGGSGATYPWVEAIVRLQRPFVVAVIFGVWAAVHVGLRLHFLDAAGLPIAAVDNAMAVVGFYLFGDRTIFYSGGQGGQQIARQAASVAGNGKAGRSS